MKAVVRFQSPSAAHRAVMRASKAAWLKGLTRPSQRALSTSWRTLGESVSHGCLCLCLCLCKIVTPQRGQTASAGRRRRAQVQLPGHERDGGGAMTV